MFCPQCGQERFSDATTYCSRCGYILTGTAELMQNGGVLPGSLIPEIQRQSPRKRGLKQGLFIFLLTFLVVPIVGMFNALIGMRPFLVGIAAVTLIFGGLLRMVYALLFEEAAPQTRPMAGTAQLGGNAHPPAALPGQHAYPVDQFRSPATGNWRDTSDLEPRSVTEGTTKLLEKEEQPRR
jgi:hypothetical protein